MQHKLKTVSEMITILKNTKYVKYMETKQYKLFKHATKVRETYIVLNPTK